MWEHYLEPLEIFNNKNKIDDNTKNENDKNINNNLKNDELIDEIIIQYKIDDIAYSNTQEHLETNLQKIIKINVKLL